MTTDTHPLLRTVLAAALASTLAACVHVPADDAPDAPPAARYIGTDEPFAANAVYFVVTDRFVNGDASNDQRDQGGALNTFDRPLAHCDGVAGNIGYLGGDFRGIADNLDYIRGMGFGALWITPVVDNPDEAFTGGSEPGCGTILSDRGKTGYHGYWGVDFFTVLAQLGDFDAANPAVLDYLSRAYLHWIDQGADAFRIDTIAWMPHTFWDAFTRRVRAEHPGFFMFGEAFDYDAAKIATHTLPGHGEVSVLDFPMKQAMDEVFGRKRLGFERLAPALHLVDGPYANPYELATFYDNHDMARMDASDEGFIDAHNWLFTARGIPVVYYGSETGFMRGRAEHAGNRNYFGQDRVDAAAGHPIHRALTRIANVRRTTPRCSAGVQLNVELTGDRAAFYRVLQDGDTAQVALVLLNKGDAPATFAIDTMLQAGMWRAALSGDTRQVAAGGTLSASVPAHGAEVWVLDGPVTEPSMVAALQAVTRRE